MFASKSVTNMGFGEIKEKEYPLFSRILVLLKKVALVKKTPGFEDSGADRCLKILKTGIRMSTSVVLSWKKTPINPC